jgi:uncharacterized protein (DUF1778 family)
MKVLATRRFEFRIADEVKPRLAAAAELVDEPVSEFVRAAAEDRAEAVLRAHRETRVPASFFDDLLDALKRPVERNEALARAARRIDQIV